MDDIEYLEEYEDLIMPGSTTEGSRTVVTVQADDESSSSIDQDIFESLFDDQSDDESDNLSKKSVDQHAKQRQERESLDSLDLLVRDLGEQVNIKNEGEKRLFTHKFPPLQANIPSSKPITPCLKKTNPDSMLRNSKSSDASTSQEKPQKRVMFAKLPNIKQALSTPSSSSSKMKENPEQHPISGRKPKDTAFDTAKISDPNIQRKLNKPQLTIVRPEKIQFKDPVDDPLSLDKVESDLELVSDVSDDSFVSLSDIVISNETKEKEDRSQNAEVSTKQTTSFLKSPATHISTANLPEKVTIISDTVLSRIDTALLESLAADDSKEAFLKEKNTKNRNLDPNNIPSSCAEIVQKETSNVDEPTAANNEEINDKNANESIENTFNDKPAETSAATDQINESSFQEQTQIFEEDSCKLAKVESQSIEDKEVPKEIKNITEKVIVSKADNSKEKDINSNTSDVHQATTIEKDTIEPSTDTQRSTIGTNTKKDSKLQDQRNSLSENSKTDSPEKVSEETLKDNVTPKDSLSSLNLQPASNKSEKKSEDSTAIKTNKPEKSNISQTPKKEQNSLTHNPKIAPKKQSSLKTETQKADQKAKNLNKDSESQKSDQKAKNLNKDLSDKPNTPCKTPIKQNPASTPSRPQEKRDTKGDSKSISSNSQKSVTENSKKEVRTTIQKTNPKPSVNPAQKIKEQKSESSSISKSIPENPKKEIEKIELSRESEKKKTTQVSGSSKEKDANATKQKFEKKDSSHVSSSSTSATKYKVEKKDSSCTTSTPIKNQTSGKTVNKSEEASPRKREADNVQKSQVTEKIVISRKSHSNEDIKRDIKPSREVSNVSATSQEKNRNPTNSVKDKRDSSVQQKTNPQIHRKIENKDSSSTIKRDVQEKKKEETKEPNSKTDQSKQKTDLSEKREIKSAKSQKPEDIKKSVNADMKTNNNKGPKEADTLNKKKVVEVGPKSEDSAKLTESKQHADKMKTSSSSIQKLNSRLENNATKLNTEPKSDGTQQQNATSSENSSVSKNKMLPTTNVASNTSNDKTKQTKVERPSLKRENSMTTSDKSNSKKLRSSSSSTEDMSKGNKSNALNLSTNTKIEKAIESIKPNSMQKDSSAKKVLNIKSSGIDSKPKDDINKDTKQTNVSKTFEKDDGKTPIKKQESTSQSKDDKSKTQNKPMQTKTVSSTSISSSITRSTKMQEKSNENKGVTEKPTESTLQTKKPEVATTSKNLQSNRKSVKSETKEKKPETVSSSSANATSSNAKTIEVSVTSDAVEEKTEQKSLTTSTIADSDNTMKESQTGQAVSSTSTEDIKINESSKITEENEITTVKNVSSSNEESLRAENNSKKTQNTKQKSTTIPSSSSKKQSTNAGNTSIESKKIPDKKDSSTSNKTQQTKTDESQTLKTTKIGSEDNEIDKMEKTTDSDLHKPAETACKVKTVDSAAAEKSNIQSSKEDGGDLNEMVPTNLNKSSNHASNTSTTKVDDLKLDETIFTIPKKAENTPIKQQIECFDSPSKNSIEKTKNLNLPKRETENHSIINQSSVDIIEKDDEKPVPNVSNEIVLRKRTSVIESKTNVEIIEQKESNQTNVSMDLGLRRQLRKRGSETSTASELDSTPSKSASDKTEVSSCPNSSKSTTDNAIGCEQVKKKPTRKNRRSRKTKRVSNEAKKNQTLPIMNSELQQNTEANSNNEKEQTEHIEKNIPSLESQPFVDQGVKVGETSAARQFLEPSVACAMEEGNEPLSDSKLDSLSMTSVESVAFSGFADSPTIGTNNEKFAEPSMPISKPLEHPIESCLSKVEDSIENFSPSPKRLRTAQSKPIVSTVITFNEWLARKSIGHSLQEKLTETQKEDLNANKGDAEKEDSQAEIEVNNEDDNKTNINDQPEEQVPQKPKVVKKVKSKPKTEIERLKESMPKDLRESGIEKLIESHFSSPHCLTKRSIAAVIDEQMKMESRKSVNTNTTVQLSLRTSTISPRVPTPVAKRFTTPTQTVMPDSKVTPSKVSFTNINKPTLRKDAKNSVKQDKLPPKCRNLRIRLNRSVVELYFRNLQAQASKAINNQQLNSYQDRSRGKKRKAAAQAGGTQAKKTATLTVEEQPAEKNTTPPQLQRQSRAARSNTSYRVKVMTISPRSRNVVTPSIASSLTTVDPTPLPQSSTTSPIKASSTNVVSEKDLLTPISEAATLATTTRRAKTKRPTATTAITTNTISNSGRVSGVSSPTSAITTQTPVQNIQTKQPTPLPEPIPLISNMTPKTEREDDYDSAYIGATQQAVQADQTLISPVGTLLSQINPSPSMDSRAQGAAASCSVPLVISGATSHSLPPIAIDNSGTRIYSFLHPTKYNTSHGYVMLDYCCPNLDGPMTAIDPTRRHAKVDAAIRELPAYITMETRLVTRAELEADSNALPASIRHKVQRITGSSKGPASKVTPSITVSTSSILSTNLTSTNVTTTTSVPPKATTALVSAATTSSTSNLTVLSAVSASVSALQKQLPSTTTLTPKTMPPSAIATTNKTTPSNGNTGTAMSTPAPTATITPTTLDDMRGKLRANLKKYDILLKKHYPRMSLLSFQQRQEIIESLANATQLLPRDIENATRLLQEYVTHMALKTATKSQLTSEISAPPTSTVATVSTRAAAPPISVANTSATGTAGIQQMPPVNTRAHSKRNYGSSSNMQRRSVPIYNSDKTVIGYQVQMVPPSASLSNVCTANSTSFTTSTSTRRYARNNTTALTTSNSTATTPRSGVFVIDKGNVSAPATPLMSTSNSGTPRTYYQEHDLHTPTTIATMARTPQASSTPLSSSGSIVTRSGGMIARGNRGVNMRQAPSRGAATKMQPTGSVTPPVTIPTTSAALLPRLPTLTRNPHLPPLTISSQPTTPINVRNMPGSVVGMEQTLQKRLTRKTAAAELLVVNHDTHGNPLPQTDEAILPDESGTTSTAHIKSEKPDEF